MGDPRPGRATEAPPPPAHPGRPAERESTPPGNLWLHGLHAVAAALANPRRRLKRLLLTAEAAGELGQRVAKPWRVQPEIVDRQRFQTFLPEDAVHQGAALLAEPLTPLALDQAIARSDGPVLLLDQVTDPRNVGAILRSAAAFGAAAVIVTIRHSPAATGVLAKSASGALEHVPLIAVRNLGDALAELGKRGFQRIGFDSDGEVAFEDVTLTRPLVMVMGAEGKGLRQRSRELCDQVARLEVPGAITSLNVSNATAIALYAASRRR
jgi:23S rRNA (guanosine2251-2'-O)-methyltransferase